MKVNKFPAISVNVFCLLMLIATSSLAQPAYLAQFEKLVSQCAPDIHPQTFKGVVMLACSEN